MRLLKIIQVVTLVIIVTCLLKLMQGNMSIGEMSAQAMGICILLTFNLIMQYYTQKGTITLFGKKFRIINKKHEVGFAGSNGKVIYLSEIRNKQKKA